ncbi:MAG: DEAD/DEAH box helicase family protein [Patescibacteria group bacterium]|nr:DEAD/DEAH box helicase family protein [Patescibacteria group bacterium]
MISEKQIELFLSIFRGRQDTYAKRWEKNDKSGYMPAYDLDWNKFMAFKARGGTMKDFPDKKPLPLTNEVIRNHLLGRSTVGIYPLLDDNSSYFIAADFDRENWQKECQNFLKVCEENKLPAYLERSRSGNGGHVWIFFDKSYPAYRSRQIMLSLLKQSQIISEFAKEISFDRLFPNQDYHSGIGLGNLIALPLQGESIKSGHTCFLDQVTFKPILNQWTYLASIQKVKPDDLDNLYERLMNSKGKPELIDTVSKKKISISVDKQICLNKDELNGLLTRYLQENLNFINSDYLTRKKIGKSVFQIEKYFNVIEESGDKIFIPRGFARSLIEFCHQNHLPHQFIDQRQKLPAVNFTTHIKLRDYQKKALEITDEKDCGVIVAPPGSGKTIMGLELIVRKSQPALIMVHRKQLMDQWIERIQSFLKIPKKDIGQICGNKRKIGKQITIAMMQSLTRIDNLSEFENSFGLIIIDECHHIPAKTFRTIIPRLNSYYLYGLTATPKRKHNDEKLIFVFIGDILAEIKAEDIKEKEDEHFQVVIRETNLTIPFNIQTDYLELLYKIVVFDSARNRLIIQDISDQVKKGRLILILTERKEHVEILNLYLNKAFEVITLTGNDSTRSKKSKLEQIKQGHFQILITTGQLFGEGMDVDNLNCLFLVFPFSFEGKLKQYIGRIQRSRSDKIIFDYRDRNIEYCEKLFVKRNKYYKKLPKENEKSLF